MLLCCVADAQAGSPIPRTPDGKPDFQGELTFRLSPDRIYDYACHEGNHSAPNILEGAREMERQGISSP